MPPEPPENDSRSSSLTAGFIAASIGLPAVYVSAAVWSRLIIIMVYGWAAYHEKGLRFTTSEGIIGHGYAFAALSNGEELGDGWATLLGLGIWASVLPVAFGSILAMSRLPRRAVVPAQALWLLIGVAVAYDFYTHNSR
jgi:hypothetical protein